jgi:hypothetical protein
MTYRQLKQRQAIETETNKETALSDRPVAIIARQSTTRQTQEHTESLKLQVEDAVEQYIQQGWSKEIITVRVAGNGTRGVSASKLRIDQRAELQDTIADIKAGVIKLVGAYSVSRLFRDKWGIQVGTFMEVCAEYDVLVKIGGRIYNFNDANDRLVFKIEAEFAAKDNELRAKLMTDARKRVSMRGEYDGRPLVVGFVVDRDKASSTYGHFLVYEPHACIIRRLYQRYRELGGRFNLLANEVVSMAVVFPDFEGWVNKLDVSKMQLKRVPGGYHISRWSLHKLLMSVEYMGYWKVDGLVLLDATGNPQQTHQAIVDKETWEYAFNRLSEVTLNGELNIERIDARAGWTTSKGKEQAGGLLAGILTSTLGNVRYSNGIYNVAELREGHSQWSNTLSVGATQIDVVFSARMAERLLEMHDMGKTDLLRQQLANMEQANKQALVSVDEQLAGYRQKITSIQAYILAVGSTADKETLQEYNEQILDARANLNALEAKKSVTQIEENSMRTLIKRIEQLTGGDKLQSTVTSRHFIGLACERIELNEYSSHFITLTIVWRAPFQQVDVCYIYREDGNRMEWAEADEFDLSMLYPLVDKRAVLERFPARTWKCITSYARLRGIERYTRVNTSGVSNLSISLRDHELLQANSWSLDSAKKHHYWLYDVSASDNSANSSG